MTNKFKKQKKNVKGITLVALVVTIIVMLILAGVALNLTIGENGIFSRANRSRIEYDIAQTREKLDLIFVDAYAEKRVNLEYNQNEFLDDYVYSKNKEVIMEEDMVTLNGYTFELDRSITRSRRIYRRSRKLATKDNQNRSYRKRNDKCKDRSNSSKSRRSHI